MRRQPSLPVLLGLLGLVTVPAGLAGGWWQLALALAPLGLLSSPAVGAVSGALSRFAPESAKGTANGLLSSCGAAGLALGALVAGTVADTAGPAWSFAAAGGLALAGALPWFLFGARIDWSGADISSAGADGDGTVDTAALPGG